MLFVNYLCFSDIVFRMVSELFSSLLVDQLLTSYWVLVVFGFVWQGSGLGNLLELKPFIDTSVAHHFHFDWIDREDRTTRHLIKLFYDFVPHFFTTLYLWFPLLVFDKYFVFRSELHFLLKASWTIAIMRAQTHYCFVMLTWWVRII